MSSCLYSSQFTDVVDSGLMPFLSAEDFVNRIDETIDETIGGPELRSGDKNGWIDTQIIYLVHLIHFVQPGYCSVAGRDNTWNWSSMDTDTN